MEHRIIPKEDYEGEVKLGKHRIRCYSPKQMKKMFPEGDYTLVGETASKSKAGKIAELLVENQDFRVSNSGALSRLLFKRSGYIAVEGGKFIAIHTSRLPFLLLFSLLMAGTVTTSTFVATTLLTPVDPGEQYNPIPEPDPMVEPIEDDNSSTDRVESPNGGGFVSMSYTLQAVLDLSDGNIDIFYQNPGKSNHDVALELYVVSGDMEILIARSGLIQAGYQLTKLTFIEDSAILHEGTYNGKYKTIYYNSETGERSLVESDLANVRIVVTQ